MPPAASVSIGPAETRLTRTPRGPRARAAEAGEHDLGPELLRALGDVVGDRVARDDAGDEQLLAVEHHSGMGTNSAALAGAAGSGVSRRQRTSMRARTTVCPCWLTMV